MIRPLQEHDLEPVLRLNQAARPALGNLDMERLRALVGMCAHALVVDEDGVQGFLLALEPGQSYASPNYRWLEERFDDHVYVDRIALAEAAQRRGLGSALYRALEQRAWNRPISCEVNLRPANEGSLRFHEHHGFRALAEQDTDGGAKRVCLMARPRPWPVVFELPVQWGDMDALGHVNNVRYFRWFESARIKLFQAIGLRADAPGKVGPILATTTCDFLAPLTYPDQVRCGARVSRLGRTSFTMEYGLWRSDQPGRLVARGSGVIVIVDYTAGTKVPVSEAMRERIRALDGLPSEA